MTNNVSKKEIRPFPLLSYALGAVVLWSTLLGLSLVWNIKTERLGILELARMQAQTAFEKDVIYRRWNAEHGGLYAPVTERTQPNPYLDVAERDITTLLGKKLTMINPAYMTRQAHEFEIKAYGIKSHITSLNPIRPENAADNWENRALKAFDNGLKEVSSVEIIDGEKYMRLMHPLITEKGCIKCHGAQGYKLGDIRGGLSISIPMAPLMAISKHKFLTLSVGHGLLLLFGLILIGLGIRHLKQQIHKRIGVEDALQQRTFDLGARAKELNCLYAISNLIEKPDISLEEIIKGVVDLIPLSMKYPEITCSRILLKDEEYKTVNFKETEWKQSSEIFVTGKRMGILEVFYLEKRPEIYEGPFFKEERHLIDEITDRLEMIIEGKWAEGALRESEKKYRSMMEAMMDLVYICSPDFRVEYMNPAMIRRTGRDATGEKCFKAIHDLDEKCSWCMHHVIQQLEHLEIDIVSPKDNHSYHVSQSPIVHEDGSVSNMIVYRDTTDFKKMETQLQQAQKMEAIGTLAGGIAHDFNNILFPISGYTEMLLLDTPGDSPLRHGLSEILAGAKRAGELVSQILTFSRQKEHELKPLKVEIIVKEALKLIRSSLPTTIEILQNVNKDLGLVMADPTQIHQIFMNLTTNAYHAMEEAGGNLNVTLKEVELGAGELIDSTMDPGSYVCLTVADTGMGMDQSVIDRIFDPYFTTKEEGKGTGLGLAVVHGIVKSHGGHISVYSEPGKGTEIKVYLPVIQTQAETAEGKTPLPIEKGNESVLLVDDREEIVSLAKEMLCKLGYHVTARTSSIEALEAFRANPHNFDLVITDLTMPNMTGDKLAQKLMAIRPDIPVILCTGFSEKMSEEKAEAIGIKAFLMKPIVMIDLAKTIREVLEKNQ